MRSKQQQSARIGAQPPSPELPPSHPARYAASQPAAGAVVRRRWERSRKPPRADHTRARSARYQAPQPSRSAVLLGAGPQLSRTTRTKRKKAYGAYPKRTEPSHWPPRQLEGRAARPVRAGCAGCAGCDLLTRSVGESVGLRGEVVAAAAVPVLVL